MKKCIFSLMVLMAGFAFANDVDEDIPDGAYYGSSKYIVTFHAIDDVYGGRTWFSLFESEARADLSRLKKDIGRYYVCTPETMSLIRGLEFKFNDYIMDSVGRSIGYTNTKIDNASKRQIAKILEHSGDYKEALSLKSETQFTRPFKMFEKSGFTIPYLLSIQWGDSKDIKATELVYGYLIYPIGTGSMKSERFAKLQQEGGLFDEQLEWPKDTDKYNYDYYGELYDKFEDYYKRKLKEIGDDEVQNTRKILDSMCAKLEGVDEAQNKILFDKSKVKPINEFDIQWLKLNTKKILEAD